jgi:hypothetical protein
VRLVLRYLLVSIDLVNELILRLDELFLNDFSLFSHFVSHVSHRRVYHGANQLSLGVLDHFSRVLMLFMVRITAQTSIFLLFSGCQFSEL